MNTDLEMPGKPRKLGILQTASNIGYSALFASLVFLLALIVPGRLCAQGITGAITGTVTDPSGAVIPGATVTVKQIETNAAKTIST
jgi:hypothetical protein